MPYNIFGLGVNSPEAVDYLHGNGEKDFRTEKPQQDVVAASFAGSPFAELAKHNMAMFEAAANAFKPGHGAPGSPASASAPGTKDSEIAALKAELATLREKVDKLGE